MCAIAGMLGHEQSAPLLQKMLTAIAHRGPDDEGFYSNHRVSLGQRRLSIIDLENGRQPISNEDETLWLVCNGEIYNYKSLMVELEKVLNLNPIVIAKL